MIKYSPLKSDASHTPPLRLWSGNKKYLNNIDKYILTALFYRSPLARNHPNISSETTPIFHQSKPGILKQWGHREFFFFKAY